MNIYNAIMKAADHITTNPAEFIFSQIFIPFACGTTGCALGWIHFFSGIKGIDKGEGDMIEASILFPGMKDDDIFYDRMDELLQSKEWRFSAALCAKGLRLYAEKYHAADKQDDGEAFQRFPAAALEDKVTSATARESV